MSCRKIAVYIHLVWATWDRIPYLKDRIQRRVYRMIVSQANQLGCTVLAINGMPDHIHVVITLPTTVKIADLVQRMKGVSSKYVNAELTQELAFKWQAGYGAFSVSRWDVPKIINYVKNQQEHHLSNELIADMEDIYKFPGT